MFANRMLLLSAALGSVLVGCGRGDHADAARKAAASPPQSASPAPAPVRAAAPKAVAKRPSTSSRTKTTATKPVAKSATKPAAKPASKLVAKPAAKSTSNLVLKVPEAHLPPAGQCRIWKADATPFKQPQARSCDGIVPTAPAGSMILYRPAKETKIVRVRYVDEHRAGHVVRVRVFDAITLKYLRDEQV